MLNKLEEFLRRYHMTEPGDTVVCALSGGADSVALTFALYLLREKLGITLTAAHFNHKLRGQESDRDEAFVCAFCRQFDIPLYCGSARVTPGKKGLEAAAREARYEFLRSLPGKIATAHTADDNAETLLMHLVRGTGLRGLGAIAPVNGRLIRPMLEVTRRQVLAFLEEYHLSFVEDSSNAGDAFLRNRIRHQVMPLLRQENPVISENLSALSLRLRQDEQVLDREAHLALTRNVKKLRQLPRPILSRVLAILLTDWGVREPEAEHIRLAEQLVFSENPSARASFPGGVTLGRVYDELAPIGRELSFRPIAAAVPGITEIPELEAEVVCSRIPDGEGEGMLVCPRGQLILRSRCSGDSITLTGGTKSLKKLFIDRKIPAARRSQVLVLADDEGILAVEGFGVNRARTEKPTIQVVIHRKTQHRADK